MPLTKGNVRTANSKKIGFLAQEPELDATLDVRGNVLSGVGNKYPKINALLTLQTQIETAEEEKFANLEDLRNKFEILTQELEKENNLKEIYRKIDRAIAALRCPRGDRSVDSLSGGERRRVALAKLLISEPDILMLDEPTNHLDCESVSWLERYLKEFRGTVLAVTHDRYFLDNVASWIVELDRGHLFPFKGNYSAWLANKQTRLALEARKEAAGAKLLKQELEWISANPKARATKNKARVGNYEKMVQDWQSNRARGKWSPGTLVIPPGPRLGQVVFQLENVTKVHGDKILLNEFSCQIPSGAIVGIVGPNGAGKTSLFNLLSGVEHVTSGKVTRGETVQLAYVSQARGEQLNDENSVYEEIAQGDDFINLGTTDSDYRIPVRAYVALFNFRGNAQEKLVADLSGGERNRVQLAKLLRRGCNVLMLDEPTNDLDVEVLRNLEAALHEFVGTALVISHDRYFLDRIATHIIAFEGNSETNFFVGNYSEYQEWRKQVMGSKYKEPGRIKFTKLEKV